MRFGRRGFLRAAAGLGGIAIVRLGRASAAGAGACVTIHRTGQAFGAAATITACHARRETAERAIEAAFAAVRGLERVLSLYVPESQIVRLNRAGRLESPDRDLVAVLRKAQAIAERSGGAFDVTVQPLWDLYAEARRAGTLPTDEAIEAARRLVDWRAVDVSDARIVLGRRGMAITLNALAQGYAADRAIAVLRAHGVRHALVDTGEIAALGAKPDGAPWIVGIRNPREGEALAARVALADGALSTSADDATRFSADGTDHHIFDPATGRSPQRLASVSVVAPSATDADALSTAALVLGPERGLALVREWAAAEAFFIFKNGAVLATEGFPRAA